MHRPALHSPSWFSFRVWHHSQSDWTWHAEEVRSFYIRWTCLRLDEPSHINNSLSSVACGRAYTIVPTYPYDGPTEAESLKLAEEHRQREEEESKRLQALLEAEDAETKRRQEEDAEKKKIQYLTSKRLCTMDPTCPGFAYEPNQPSICRECGFSVQFHTKIVQDEEET